MILQRTLFSYGQLDGPTPRFYFAGGISPGRFWSIERVYESAHCGANRSSGWNVAAGRDARCAPHVGPTCTRFCPSRNWPAYLRGRAASEAKKYQEIGIEGKNRPLRGPISPSRTSLRCGRELADSRNPWSSQASFLAAFFIAFRTPQNFPSIPIFCQISSDSRAQRSRK